MIIGKAFLSLPALTPWLGASMKPLVCELAVSNL